MYRFKLPLLLIILGFIFAGLGCNSQSNHHYTASDTLHWVHTNNGNLHLFTYNSKMLTDSPHLVVVLHGDAPFNKPGYQYKMARMIAEQNENTIAIGLLRPGYTDDDENTSDGIRGLTTGDNYTPAVINAISEAIDTLKRRYHPSNTILIGHSGGAAITGDIVGLKPGLVNKAFLVSCPCDLRDWRKYMSHKQPDNASWKDPVTSISPLSLVDKISRTTELFIVCGEKDEVTPIEISKVYYKTAKVNDLKTTFISIPGKGHEIFLERELFNIIHQAIQDK